jgi:peroxiredoxin family protein
VIKRHDKDNVKKDVYGKMFSMMLPDSSKGLGLSKMNMAGAGSWMMRKIMRKKNIESLEGMMKTAIDNGVELIACQMSMDVMGIKAEELIEGVQVGGVATYLERTEGSNLNLFV